MRFPVSLGLRLGRAVTFAAFCSNLLQSFLLPLPGTHTKQRGAKITDSNSHEISDLFGPKKASLGRKIGLGIDLKPTNVELEYAARAAGDEVMLGGILSAVVISGGE